MGPNVTFLRPGGTPIARSSTTCPLSCIARPAAPPARNVSTFCWAIAGRGTAQIIATTRGAHISLRRSRVRPAAARRPAGTQVALWTAGRVGTVLETSAIILIILSLLGMVSGCTLGNLIWSVRGIAVVLFLVRLVSGRRVV